MRAEVLEQHGVCFCRGLQWRPKPAGLAAELIDKKGEKKKRKKKGTTSAAELSNLS